MLTAKQQQIAVSVLVAQIRQRIFIAAAALDLSGIGVVQSGLADQIERQIGERDVLLQGRASARPF